MKTHWCVSGYLIRDKLTFDQVMYSDYIDEMYAIKPV